MILRRSNGTWVVVMTFIGAYFLQIYPYPSIVAAFMPKWVVLVLMFWVIALPHRVGILVAWSVGLFLDVMEGSLLGQNALALSIVSYVLLILYQMMRMYESWQQACVIFVLVVFYQFWCNWVSSIEGLSLQQMDFILPALVTALAWTFCWNFLQKLSQILDVK